ncbi:hypothetical protein GGS20DRAFT_391564 [Poronia punctata]|nr:hypothetical protein GGS20DRAFT_391564 [Poronia punctata]
MPPHLSAVHVALSAPPAAFSSHFLLQLTAAPSSFSTHPTCCLVLSHRLNDRKPHPFAFSTPSHLSCIASAFHLLLLSSDTSKLSSAKCGLYLYYVSNHIRLALSPPHPTLFPHPTRLLAQPTRHTERLPRPLGQSSVSTTTTPHPEIILTNHPTF